MLHLDVGLEDRVIDKGVIGGEPAVDNSDKVGAGVDAGIGLG